jgi:predicted phage terminase large subunit-like protein
VPVRMRCASNPGGVGHEWVKARFVDPGDPERPFVPAKLEDNPHLDIEEYDKALAQLDHLTREQLRAGRWDVLPEGRLFKREWFKIIDPHELPAGLKEVRFWDNAATEQKPGTDPDWTAGLRLGRNGTGVFYVEDVKRVRERPQGVEALVTRTAEEDGRPVWIVMEQEPGSSGVTVVDYYRRRLAGYAFKGLRTTGSKTERAAPVSAQAEAGNIVLVRGAWNAPFLDELCAFPTEGVHDDQVDALSGALAVLAVKQRAWGW